MDMLARLQRFIAITLLLFVGLWAMLGAFSENTWWSAGGIALVALAYTATLALEFLFLRASYAREDPKTPRPIELLSAWLQESLAAPRVFLWRQPFRSRAQTDSIGEASTGRRGVVLIHGFFCNRGIWNSWMKRLRAAGIPYVAVNLEPVFGSIDSHDATIDEAVSAVYRGTGLPPIVVAHSMGGLVFRHWLTKPDAGTRFHRAVTIATPHRGTWLARFGRTANGVQMREGADWLTRLAAAEEPSSWQRFVCFWSHCDNIVFPTTNATLPGADNRHLRATPHVRMVDHPEVIGAVVELALSSTSTPRRT